MFLAETLNLDSSRYDLSVKVQDLIFLTVFDTKFTILYMVHIQSFLWWML